VIRLCSKKEKKKLFSFLFISHHVFTTGNNENVRVEKRERERERERERFS
jgi:hypothetical protein